jgi:hypothetical protein
VARRRGSRARRRAALLLVAPACQPFDFLTWFEYSPADASRFEELVGRLRETEAWRYVEREIDVRLTQPNPCLRKGRSRTRCPVAAKTALASAGATTGVGGSPTPVGGNSLMMVETLTLGMRSIRSTG